MKSKAQMEAADRMQRERLIRLSRYSQGRKDQDTIKRLRTAMKGKGKDMPSAGATAKKHNTGDYSAALVGATDNMVFRSLDPSMFKYVLNSMCSSFARTLA
jgi:hypothetical protein